MKSISSFFSGGNAVQVHAAAGCDSVLAAGDLAWLDSTLDSAGLLGRLTSLDLVCVDADFTGALASVRAHSLTWNSLCCSTFLACRMLSSKWRLSLATSWLAVLVLSLWGIMHSNTSPYRCQNTGMKPCLLWETERMSRRCMRQVGVVNLGAWPFKQVPVLRLVAESLGEATCEAIERGYARNLVSLHLTHLREEEEVQVRSTSAQLAMLCRCSLLLQADGAKREIHAQNDINQDCDNSTKLSGGMQGFRVASAQAQKPGNLCSASASLTCRACGRDVRKGLKYRC